MIDIYQLLYLIQELLIRHRHRSLATCAFQLSAQASALRFPYEFRIDGTFS